MLHSAAWCCVVLRGAAWCCGIVRDYYMYDVEREGRELKREVPATAMGCCLLLLLRVAAWCCVVLRGVALRLLRLRPPSLPFTNSPHLTLRLPSPINYQLRHPHEKRRAILLCLYTFTLSQNISIMKSYLPNSILFLINHKTRI